MFQTKCYHGTIQPFAISILTSNHFNMSRKPNEWLGYGIYFFLHYEEADWWAHIQANRHSSEKAVLEVLLEFPDETFLNLDLLPCARSVNLTFINFLNKLKKDGAIIPKFRDEAEERCFAIELYKKLHPEIKVIAYTFDAPGKAFKGYIFKPRQLQYCVVDNSIIKSINLTV